MTVIAKGHSYRDRQTNREYLVTEMPYKRNWLNMLLCRNTRMVKVREYPLAMRGLKEETFPLVHMKRWGLIDIPTHVQSRHRTRNYLSYARDNTELNKKLTKTGQTFHLR